MAAFTKLTFKPGKSKTAKIYQGQAQAKLLVAINRYHCGMTVGHGWYSNLIGQDPVGSACTVLGWWDDGRVAVGLPVGGFGTLGRADVEIVAWPNYVSEEDQALWNILPRVSRVIDGEIQK